jgi:hypothetical protein
MELSSYRESAFAWQGRYTLPLAVGIPLLLGLRPSREVRTSPEPGRAGIVTTTIVVVGSIHVASFAGPLIQYLRGIDALWTGSPGGWNPPVRGLFLVVVFTAVVAAGAWTARRLAATPAVHPATPAGSAAEAREPDRLAQAASTPTT